MTNKAFFDTNILIYALTVRAGSAIDARTEMAERILSLGGMAEFKC